MAKPTDKSAGRAAASREAVFHTEFRNDLRYWLTADRNVALRVLDLVEAVVRERFSGIGKPEPPWPGLGPAAARRSTGSSISSAAGGSIFFKPATTIEAACRGW